MSGRWGTVCHDERSWSVHNAEVVCEQLGYGPIGECVTWCGELVFVSFTFVFAMPTNGHSHRCPDGSSWCLWC